MRVFKDIGKLRRGIVLLTAIVLTCMAGRAAAESRDTVLNPFALTEIRNWQFGLEESTDVPPTRWRDTRLPHRLGEKKVLWYRFRFIVRARPRIPLGLMPGGISNTDRAYLNGQLIGSTGRDDRKGGAFGRLRLYYLPTELLKIASTGKGNRNYTNEFLIRVQGHERETGIIRGPHRAGPMGLLRRHAHLDSLPGFAAAMILLTAFFFTLPGLLSGGHRLRHALFALLLLATAAHAGLAADIVFNTTLTFHDLKRWELITLCLIPALLPGAVFELNRTGKNIPALTAVWLPAGILLPAAIAVFFMDDHSVRFFVRDGIVRILAPTIAVALLAWSGFLLLRRRNRLSLLVFLGLLLLVSGLLLDLSDAFRLFNGPGRLLHGAGFLVLAGANLFSVVSEERRIAPQLTPRPLSLESPRAFMELLVPPDKTEPAGPALVADIRLAGRNYFTLLMGRPVSTPDEFRRFLVLSHQALERMREPLQSESTFPEAWLSGLLSDLRRISPGPTLDADSGEAFLGLLDPHNGFLYYVCVGRTTLQLVGENEDPEKIAGTPTSNRRVQTYQMQAGQRLVVRQEEARRTDGEAWTVAVIKRAEKIEAGTQPDEATRTRMRTALEGARRGRRIEAIRVYEELNQRYPDTESIGQNLALLHIKERNLSLAARLYEQCSRVSPAVEKYIYQAALANYRDKNHLRAAALTERLILRNPDHLEGLLLMCELLRLMDYNDASNEHLERARKIAGDDPRVEKLRKLVVRKGDN